ERDQDGLGHAQGGAVVVFLGPGLPRAASTPAERGLPLLWRAAPAGVPPGGAQMSETVFAPKGLQGRPWSPAHLRCLERTDGGFDLSWVPRSRLEGDRWDGQVGRADPARYRVCILGSGTVIRSFETTTDSATYPAAEVS